MFISIILSLIFGRWFIAYLYFFTDWFYWIFDTKFRPIIWFILMPFTLLRYSAVQNWYYGHWWFWQVVVMIIAILIDISSLGSATTSEQWDDSENEIDDDVDYE